MVADGTRLSATRQVKTAVWRACLANFCFGYNTAVIAGALLYMEEDPGLAPLNSFEQGVIVSCALAGATLGALMLSLLDRFGHRPTLLLTAWGFVVGPAITAAAPHLVLLIVGRVVAGISVGLTSGIVNLYRNEIAPAHVRGELSGFRRHGKGK